MSETDVHAAAVMLVALADSDEPIDVLALVCKAWIEQRKRWSPWRRLRRSRHGLDLDALV